MFRRRLVRLGLGITVRPGRSAPAVKDFITKVRQAPVSPKELAKLGLDPKWHQRLDDQVIERIVAKALEYKRVLKELSKR